MTGDLKLHYRKSYGRYNTDPDFTKCCRNVYASSPFGFSYQCKRRNGHGPDGAYCKQHSPEAVEMRRQKEQERFFKDMKANTVKSFAPRALKALKKIADGHNDPQAVAQDVLDKLLESDFVTEDDL